ncbi:nicotinate (nicotinamide) nucleotide adenylyltransferase [Mangrovivirga sp. M17]|uniref:Probable nicotinate-nucleotide adenylyltransferase n=1 Tax=Mangrovivirga halotolerans TaxID=2993936 RepID=A0ABT3RU14_9BACT|nr:nicotinate (nicotinamide) nucleotide adenylyltransferase [Mangrovivirga halotolerans]MCX2745062.1 nicotinate (nicotinamide) nucleotide adenylyltransferase [Mangrovivirga halotolerans]
MNKTIGLYFGSFNPIHIGHLIIAQTIVDSDNVDEVWFVVSPQSPFKKRSSLAHEQDRYDMVQAAIFDNYKFRVTDIEFNMPKPSYTIDTLTYLREKYSDYQFKLIMGEDNLKGFHKWKNHEELISQTGIICYPRPGTRKTKWHDDDRVQMIDAPFIDISATFIRDSVRGDKSIKYLVPKETELLIKSRKLYD